MRSLIGLSLALAGGAVLSVSIARADDAPVAGSLAVQKTVKIGGEGRWDYVSVDPAAHRLYVTRSTHTQVLDLETDKVILDVPGQQRAHGAVAVPAVGRGFITDGKAGTIVIFDLKTGEVLGSAAAAEDADGEIYDAGSNKILATCGDAGVMVAIDPAVDPKAAKAESVDLGGKPEFLAADGDGKAYVCINDKSQLAVVDLKTMKATAHYPIGSGTGPTGLAIDAKNGRLFVGCRNQKLIVLNTADGKVLAELPIGKGNDACAFDPGSGTAFASCGDGSLTVVKETVPGTFAVIQTVKTPKGARTMAVDPTTHLLYLPTAEFNPAQPGERRPMPKPDSFQIVVVGAAAK